MRSRLKIHSFLRMIGIALLTTIVFYFIAVLINHGSLIYDKYGNFIFGQILYQEIFFTFLFLLSIIGAHSLISKYFNTSAYWQKRYFLKAFVEIFVVIITSVLLLTLVYFVPFFLIFPEIEPDPEQFRTGYVLSIFFSLFFYFLVEREKNQKIYQAELLKSAQLQKENFQAQLQHLRNQISPHFLFNSLNILSSLIRKDQNRAVLFTQKLSEVYKAFLNYSDKQLISLEKEIQLNTAYIYLLTTRFGANIKFEINIDDHLKTSQLPPGSLQMLVENVVKHNGSTLRNPLTVLIYTDSNKLVVKNNIRPRKEQVQSTGTGITNIKRRYKYLSEQEVEIDATGNEFTVKLPLLNMK